MMMLIKPTLIGGVVGLLLGAGIMYLALNRTDNATTQEVRQSGYTYISPLIECEVSASNHASVGGVDDAAQDAVSSVLSSKNARAVSVYYRDLNNGPWFGIDEDTPFAPASLLKVPVLMAVLHVAETDTTVFDWEVSVGDGTAAVEELLEQMIIESSNDAFSALVRFFGVERVDEVHEVLGIPLPTETTLEDFITVKEYASLFRVLYNTTYLNREMSERALELLAQTSYTDGLVAGLPTGTSVAHKYGIQGTDDNPTRQLHDCGVVYHPTNPYLLCVMTKGSDKNDLARAIATVSRAVWNAVDDR